MKKNILSLTLVSAVLTLTLVGCGSMSAIEEDITKGTGDSLGYDYNISADPTYPYGFDYLGQARSYSNNNLGYSDITSPFILEGTKSYGAINEIEGVEDSKVIIMGINAYCGLDKNKTQLGEEEIEKIKTEIKRHYPQVKNIYFSYEDDAIKTLDEAIINKTENLSEDIINMFM